MGKRNKMRGNLEIKVGVQGKLSHTKETINSMYNRKEHIFRKKNKEINYVQNLDKKAGKRKLFRG